MTNIWRLLPKTENGIAASDNRASTSADPHFATYHDMLLNLVTKGVKRATAHKALDVERYKFTGRQVGDYWVIVTTDIELKFPVCVDEVEVDFAAREGKGDSSLAYLRDVHRDYFFAQCADLAVEWRQDMPTVCEGFELIATT